LVCGFNDKLRDAILKDQSTSWFFVNRDQHIFRLNAWILCQVVHHVLVKSLFDPVGTPSMHNQMHHDAICTAVLQ